MTEWARIAYGLVLLAVPNRVLRLASDVHPTARERAVTRVLGARLLVQGAVTVVRPDAVTLALGAETDFVHAATMLAWAVVDRRARRLTVLSAATAALFGAAGAVQATHAPAPAPQAGSLGALLRLRHQVAVLVARRTLPRAVNAGVTT
jgi:hypothetical protein